MLLMTKILSIDTATDICTVAISEKGEVISFRDSAEDRSHSVLLAVYIEEVLNETKLKVEDLDAVAISKGPGSYTGLRIGVSSAKGLCYGADIPLISVSTLQAMCFGIPETFLSEMNLADFYFAPMLDARRMEVYTALYDSSYQTKVGVNALILDESSFFKYLEEKPVIFFGSGANKFKEIVTHKNAFFYSDFKHSARFMKTLATSKLAESKFEDVAYFEPFYLKDFVTTTPKKNILFPSKKEE